MHEISNNRSAAPILSSPTKLFLLFVCTITSRDDTTCHAQRLILDRCPAGQH